MAEAGRNPGPLIPEPVSTLGTKPVLRKSVGMAVGLWSHSGAPRSSAGLGSMYYFSWIHLLLSIRSTDNRLKKDYAKQEAEFSEDDKK